MSYSVIHMTKLKMGAMKGIENHNERAKESRTNPDIDKTRTHLNYDLHRIDDPRTYYMRVKDRIRELNLKKAVRKDAVVSVGFITTSDKEFFDQLTAEQTKRYFEASYEFLKKRYGEENVISSKVHLDERTPHMHTYIVPVTSDGRLSAKSIFTRIELKNLQDEYNKHMRASGFNLEKGESTRGHIEMAEFKKQTAYKELEKIQSSIDLHAAAAETLKKTVSKSSVERDKLIQEINALQDSFKSLKNDYERVKGVKFVFDEINAIESKFEPLNKDIVKIKSSDFEKLKDIAKNFRLHEIEIEHLYQELNNLNERDIERERELNSLIWTIEVVKKYMAETNQTVELDKFIEYQAELEQINSPDLDYDPEYEF